jgi:hypothetical protein
VKVKVDIFAKNYETSKPLEGNVTDIATGDTWRTDKTGYAHIEVEAGRKLNLVFNKIVQTATVKVPDSGLTGEDKEITLQVPGAKLYKALRVAIGKPKAGTHHIVTTVSAEGHTLHNDKGEAGVTVTLKSKDGKVVRNDAMYLGTVLGKTEWLRPIAAARVPGLKKLRHKSTSHDGGAIFRDVPPGDYILEAHKDGVLFSRAKVTVFKNSPELVNVSPPHSPHVVKGPKP